MESPKSLYLKIFKYLKKFSELRSQTVRDMESSQTYQKILWMDELPDVPEISHILNDPEKHDAVSFLEILKPKEILEPKFQINHKVDRDWIKKESLTNESDGPQLIESRIINDEIIYSENDELLLDSFYDYRYNYWENDLDLYLKAQEECQTYLSTSEIFQDIFSIHNKITRFSEEFEVVMAIGQLTFSTVNGMRINRAILTQAVNIEFEFTTKTKLIVQPTENDKINVELDAIIDLDDVFDIDSLYKAEKDLKHDLEQLESNTSLFDENIHLILQKFIEKIHPDSVYAEGNIKANSYDEKPRLTFAPSIIFRKRTAQRLTAVYQEIINQINDLDNEATIPSLNTFIGIESERVKETSKRGSLDEIYFPLPFNDEQLEIAHKAKFNDKVLVQGPPGTGKSHTISNLISDLLAKGKKVLVTAQTKRALEVLHDKLPYEISKIVVNLLSSDSDSVNQLKSSVNHIISELGSRSLKQLNDDVESMQLALDSTREKISKTKNNLTKLKEEISAYREYNSEYRGTPTKVASELDQKREVHGWYKDEFHSLDYSDILAKYGDFLEKENYYENQDITEYHQEILSIQDLPTTDSVELFFDINPEEQGTTIYKYDSFSTEELVDLTGKLKELLKLIKGVHALDIPSKKLLIKQYQNLKQQRFKARVDRCKEILEKYEHTELRDKDRHLEIEINSNKSLKIIKNDAVYLWDYIKKGGKLQGTTFNLKKTFFSKELKEKLYLINDVLINGSPCDTREEFEELINDIETTQDFEEVNEFLGADIDSLKGQERKYDELSRILNELEGMNTLLSQESELRDEINLIIEEKVPFLDLDKTKSLIKELQRKQFEKNAHKIKKTIGTLISRIKGQRNPHMLSNEIVKALDDRDYYKYGDVFDKYTDLIARKSEFENHISLIDELRLHIPSTINESIHSKNYRTKEELEAAILYKNTFHQLTKETESSTLSNVAKNLATLEKKELQLIEELASKKAWVELQKRLETNSYLTKHLQAWALAVKKIGKTGRGQRAQKWKKEAQKEMEHCKDAIPCWIMPLFKVAETINPSSEIFDYVIIDEASQLGPDAIFLSYIAKNIIIVGDDKQTSPEYVGIEASKMEPHITRYLQGIPFDKFYGMEFSFFDHARLFCDGITVLKEHFRCMPEIIEFSNKHFYSPEGNELYPLRQYSANRLKPLESRYCETGNVLGKGSSIINKPEAKELVATIASLIENDDYNNKSFGVICLQGHAQAKHIEALLLNTIGAEEFEKRHLVCGNSTSFQGDERDVIFMSLVTAPNHNSRSLTSPNDERRFNVAMSRAKDQVWLFHSVKSGELSNTQDLRYKLLQHFTDEHLIPEDPDLHEPTGQQPPQERFDSEFEIEVYKELVKRGYKVTPQYEIAGGRFRIDLVVSLKNGKRIGIECDGDEWHGSDRFESDMMRQKILERSGWTILRVRGSEFYCDREVALKPIVKTLGSLESDIKSDNSSPRTSITHTPIGSTEDHSETTNEVEAGQEESVKPKEEQQFEKVDDSKVIHFDKPSKDTSTWVYIFDNGNYMVQDKETTSTTKHIKIPITKEDESGFLLQCYEGGHINKIGINFFLAKSRGKIYSNGLFTGGKLQKIILCRQECLIGIKYIKSSNWLFKAHRTEDISLHTTPHLKGNKVISTNIYQIEYTPIDSKWEHELSKLVFNSFTAKGKWVDNSYYQNEWGFIKQKKILGELHGPLNKEVTWAFEKEQETQNIEIKDDRNVNLGDIVTVRFDKINQTRQIKIVRNKNLYASKTGVDLISSDSPLAQAILGKKLGDKVVVGSITNLVEIKFID